jgi:4-hydroxy-tetrahydrodipicolinate reductase
VSPRAARVCLSGARGRMGQLLAGFLQRADDLSLGAALERSGHPDLGLDLGGGVRLGDEPRAALEASDALLDFGPPASVLEHAELAARLGRPVVTGTTGFDASQMAALRALGSRVAVLQSANMSRGVFLLTDLARQAAALLGPEYDAEILELHHRGKADAPSGTALRLAEALAEASGRGPSRAARPGARQPGEVGLASIRGGDVVGEHQIMFLGPGEQLVLIHRAGSREHFCRGALDAVRFLVRARPGFYGMGDVFGAGGGQAGGGA